MQQKTNDRKAKSERNDDYDKYKSLAQFFPRDRRDPPCSCTSR